MPDCPISPAKESLGSTSIHYPVVRHVDEAGEKARPADII
jgi:hypothetical protein